MRKHKCCIMPAESIRSDLYDASYGRFTETFFDMEKATVFIQGAADQAECEQQRKAQTGRHPYNRQEILENTTYM